MTPTAPTPSGSRKFQPGAFVMVSVTRGTVRLAQVVEPTLATLPHEIRVQVQESGEVFDVWQDTCRLAWPKEAKHDA